MDPHDVRLADDVDARGTRRPDAAARLLLPVADALTGLHARGAAHGALSPHAVAIRDDGPGVLVDREHVFPDPLYMAPAHPPGTGSAQADDVWAFAAVLTFTITGRPPRGGRHPAQYTGWLAPLTELALLSEPGSRPSMAEVADYLRARVAPVAATARGGAPGVRLALVGAGAVVLLGILGAWLLFGGGDGDPRADPTPADTTATSATSAPDTEPTTETSSTEETPTAEDLEQFARDYVTTASDDPDAGFTLLTKDYRAASPRYREVWTAITDPRILTVTADADRLTVTYTYRYALPGGTRQTEEVTLRLVERDGDLLIAGASSRPR